MRQPLTRMLFWPSASSRSFHRSMPNGPPCSSRAQRKKAKAPAELLSTTVLERAAFRHLHCFALKSAGGRTKCPGCTRDTQHDERICQSARAPQFRNQYRGNSAGQVENDSGVGPFFESREPWNGQCCSAEQLPYSENEQEIWRIAQVFDEIADLGNSHNIPRASQGQFEDNQASGHPISNDVGARTGSRAVRQVFLHRFRISLILPAQTPPDADCRAAACRCWQSLLQVFRCCPARS